MTTQEQYLTQIRQLRPIARIANKQRRICSDAMDAADSLELQNYHLGEYAAFNSMLFVVMARIADAQRMIRKAHDVGPGWKLA